MPPKPPRRSATPDASSGDESSDSSIVAPGGNKISSAARSRGDSNLGHLAELAKRKPPPGTAVLDKSSARLGFFVGSVALPLASTVAAGLTTGGPSSATASSPELPLVVDDLAASPMKAAKGVVDRKPNKSNVKRRATAGMRRRRSSSSGGSSGSADDNSSSSGNSSDSNTEDDSSSDESSGSSDSNAAAAASKKKKKASASAAAAAAAGAAGSTSVHAMVPTHEWVCYVRPAALDYTSPLEVAADAASATKAQRQYTASVKTAFIRAVEFRMHSSFGVLAHEVVTRPPFAIHRRGYDDVRVVVSVHCVASSGVAITTSGQAPSSRQAAGGAGGGVEAVTTTHFEHVVRLREPMWRLPRLALQDYLLEPAGRVYHNQLPSADAVVSIREKDAAFARAWTGHVDAAEADERETAVDAALKGDEKDEEEKSVSLTSSDSSQSSSESSSDDDSDDTTDSDDDSSGSGDDDSSDSPSGRLRKPARMNVKTLARAGVPSTTWAPVAPFYTTAAAHSSSVVGPDGLEALAAVVETADALVLVGPSGALLQAVGVCVGPAPAKPRGKAGDAAAAAAAQAGPDSDAAASAAAAAAPDSGKISLGSLFTSAALRPDGAIVSGDDGACFYWAGAATHPFRFGLPARFFRAWAMRAARASDGRATTAPVWVAPVGRALLQDAQQQQQQRRRGGAPMPAEQQHEGVLAAPLGLGRGVMQREAAVEALDVVLRWATEDLDASVRRLQEMLATQAETAERLRGAIATATAVVNEGCR